MGHAVGNDVVRPLLECLVVEIAVLAEGCVVLQQRIHFRHLHNGIFVDYLEGSHAHQRLHVSVGEVGGHVAEPDTFQVGVQYIVGHAGIADVAAVGIQTGGIEGDTQNLLVERGNVAA